MHEWFATQDADRLTSYMLQEIFIRTPVSIPIFVSGKIKIVEPVASVTGKIADIGYIKFNEFCLTHYVFKWKKYSTIL